MASQSAAASYGAGVPENRGPLSEVLGGIVSVLRSIPAAAQAASTFNQLYALSDEGLARRGLKREDVPRHVFDTYFAERS